MVEHNLHLRKTTVSMESPGSSNLLVGCRQEQVGAVQVVGIILRMSRRIEPEMMYLLADLAHCARGPAVEPAGGAVGEVAGPWPGSARDLVLRLESVLGLET